MKCLLLLLACAAAAGAQTYDLVVYGGTAGGAITAVSGARMGLKTVLLEPRQHIGGMVSGGLSRTDVGKREVIGGYSLEFYWRAGNAYNMAQYLQEIAWLVEPKVAESIFRKMLDEAGVTVLFHQRLREKDGVRKSGGRIQAITMENGAQYTARMFADCTYEGDLMAQAGVTYTWGRESSAQYGESLAGVRGETPFHQFLVDLSPKGADGKLLPEISAAPAGEPGSADRKVQAYNFRMILSHDPANQVAYPKPAHYDPARFELFARLLDAMQKKQGRPSRLGEVLSVIPVPNHKADINNNGAFSTDYIGKSWDYPNASYARREEIWRDHEEYTKQLFWFLAHDPRVPPSLQKEVNEWGLAKDEFLDTDHWPQPALHPRSAPHGGRVRDEPEGYPDRPHASRTRSGWAPTTAIRTTCSAWSTRTASCATKATCRWPCSPTRFRTASCCPRRTRCKTCWCRSASPRPTWPTARCAWSRST